MRVSAHTRPPTGLLVALCVAAVLVCPGGAGAEPLSPEALRDPAALRGHVDVWGWNIAAASLDKLVPGFRERYPGCVVNVHMTGANLQSRFLLSLSAGVGAPDISQLQEREAPRYAVTGRLTDLTAVAARYEKDFPPSFWTNCVHDGRVYAVPWDIGPCGVFYKRGLFARYDIDPESIETWDDYIAAGRELVERSQGRTKMLCLPTGQLSDLFEMLLQQSGGQVFDDEGRIALNSQETFDALDVIRRMIESGIGASIGLGSHEFLASLKSDTVATYPTAAWFGGTIRDEAPASSGDWGVFRLPAIHPGGLRASNLGGSVLVIPDQSRQKEAAWAFIEYVLCTHGPQIEQYRNFDLFPALITTHDDPFFDEPVEFFGGQRVRRLFSLDFEKVPAMRRTTDWMEAIRYINQALSRWAAGERGDLRVLLTELERRLSTRLGRAIAPSSLSRRTEAGEP